MTKIEACIRAEARLDLIRELVAGGVPVPAVHVLEAADAHLTALADLDGDDEDGDALDDAERLDALSDDELAALLDDDTADAMLDHDIDVD